MLSRFLESKTEEESFGRGTKTEELLCKEKFAYEVALMANE